MPTAPSSSQPRRRDHRAPEASARTKGSAESGWEDFVDRYATCIRWSAHRALKRAGMGTAIEEVEDTAQEVYCKLLAGSISGPARFGGASDGEIVSYLRRVTRSVLVDRVRRERAFKRQGCLPSHLSWGEPAVLEEQADEGVSPEDRLLVEERERSILETCRSVAGSRKGSRDFRIFRLAIAGWNGREIAERVEGLRSPSTVYSVVHRIRNRLQQSGI